MRYFFILLYSLVPFFSQMNAQASFSISYGTPFQIDELNDFSFSGNAGSSWTGDFKYVKKRIGFGLQYSRNNFQPNQDLFSQYELIPGVMESSDFESWRANLFSVGPVLRLGKPGFQIDFFPKVGYMDINSADQKFSLANGDESISLYKENEALQTKSGAFYGLDGSLSLRLTDWLGLQFFAGYNTNTGIGTGCSSTYREIENAGNSTTVEDVLASRLLQKDCSAFGLITTGVGISINFSRKPQRKKPGKMLPPVPLFPEDGTSVPEGGKDELELRWQPEQPEVKQANYSLFLYAVTSSDSDSLIYRGKTSKELRLQLPPDIKLSKGNTYRWKVQAIEHKDLLPCPDGCNSTYFQFEVSGLGLPSFYQLLDENIGLAVPCSGLLRFVVDDDMLYTGQLTLQLLNQTEEIVLDDVDIRKGEQEIKTYETNRFELPVSKLAAGQEYTLVVSNGKQKQYLRFYRAGTKLPKDE